MPNKTFYHLTGNLNKVHPRVVKAKGNYIHLEDGQKIFDAAVTSLGYDNNRVKRAVNKQMNTGAPYLSSAYWSNSFVQDLSQMLIVTTEGKLSKIYLTGSGSEASEAALKLACQYYHSRDKSTSRVNFISRDRSYHGNTIGALSV